MPLPAFLPYRVWYVRGHSLRLLSGEGHPDPQVVESLAADIRGQGLVNPLLVRPDGYVTQGRTRLAALRLLGWTHAPAIIVGGPPPAHDAVEVSTDELPSFFRDGSPFTTAYGIALTGTTPPETYQYPRIDLPHE